MTSIRADATVGQLVAERPSRTRVLERFGIDYCCGGKLSLRDASAAQGLELEAVLAALAESDRGAPAAQTDWLQVPLSDLIENIVSTHHAYLRDELPRLGLLVEKVARVHGGNHAELLKVRETFEALRGELELHMMKEEQILFPMVQGMEAAQGLAPGHCGSVSNPIRVMEFEHDSAGRALQRMRELTGDYAPPADACGSYRALLAGLGELEGDLHEHIHKENNILFPRAMAFETALAQRGGAFAGR